MKPSFLPAIIAGAVGAIVASLIPLLVSPSRAETKLLPFQGRLTDAAGNAIGDGARVVEFKMYDAPTGGNVKWAGEVHKLSINGGLVNTMLGSKAGLGSVDFATATFLQITVDANGDGSITAADPPLLPRQSVVGSVYAAVAGGMRYQTEMGSFSTSGWEAVFDNGRPDTGKIPPGKLATDAVETSQIVNGTLRREDFSDEALSGFIPVGAVLPWTGSGAAPYAPPPGWLLCNGQTIGRPGSAASYSDNDARALYFLIWNQWSPAVFKLLRPDDGSAVGAGVSAQADWDAGKRLVLPDMRGRVAVGAGAGAVRDDFNRTLSNRALGTAFGEEVHVLAASEIPAHSHPAGSYSTTVNGNHVHSLKFWNNDVVGVFKLLRKSTVQPSLVQATGAEASHDSMYSAGDHSHTVVGDSGVNSPNGGTHNIMQPSIAITHIIKL